MVKQLKVSNDSTANENCLKFVSHSLSFSHLTATTINDEILNFLDDDDDDSALNDEMNVGHANTSKSTANREMNNGIEKDLQNKSECNETMSVNNNHTTALNDITKVKRE